MVHRHRPTSNIRHAQHLFASMMHRLIQSTRRGRLACMELGLCIGVPVICLGTWLICDSEFRNAVLARHTPDAFNSSNPVYALLPWGEDEILAVHSHGQIRNWHRHRQELRGEIQSQLNDIRCAAISKKGRVLAVGNQSDIEVWNLDQLDRPIARRHLPVGYLRVLEFSPDGAHLCGAGETGIIQLYHPTTLELLSELNSGAPSNPIRCVAFTADNRTLLAGNQRGEIQVWDMTTRTLLHVLPQPELLQPTHLSDSHMERLLILPDQARVVAVTRRCGIAIWDIKSGRRLQNWTDTHHESRSATLTQQGEHLLVGTESGELVSWNIASGECQSIEQIGDQPVTALLTDSSAKLICADVLGQLNWRFALAPTLGSDPHSQQRSPLIR